MKNNVTIEMLPHFVVPSNHTLEELLDKENQKRCQRAEQLKKFLNKEGIPHAVKGSDGTSAIYYCFAPGGILNKVLTEADVKKAREFWEPILSGKRNLATVKAPRK